MNQAGTSPPGSSRGPDAQLRAEHAPPRQPGDGKPELVGAPWKLLLPALPDRPVLAMGLPQKDLRELARGRVPVHVLLTDEDSSQLPQCAEKEGELIGVSLACLPPSYYRAVAVGPKHVRAVRPDEVAQLLCPGGASAWIGGRGTLPAKARLLSAGFDSALLYARLPRATGKILLPLNQKRATRRGLFFYTPGKWHKRAALRLADIALCLGCQIIFSPSVVVGQRQAGKAPKNAYLLDWLSGSLGAPVADVTIHSGWRKRTLLLLDEDGEPLAVAKAADNPVAKEAMGRETEALNQIARSAELRRFVPAVLAVGHWGEHDVQVQSTAPLRVRYSTALTATHMSFLTALMGLGRREMSLTQWPSWERLYRAAQQWAPASADDARAVREAIEAARTSLREARIPFHRIHGDFAPWNIRMAPGQFVVVDWEQSDAQGLPFYDLVHFKVRVDRLLKRKSVRLRDLLLEPQAALPVRESLDVMAGAFRDSALQALKAEQKEALVRLCLVNERLSAYDYVAL